MIKEINSLSVISFISLILIILALFLTYSKYTIAPIWFIGDYPSLSFNNKGEDGDGISFGYKHRGHDQVMQFFLNQSDSLRQYDLDRNETYSDKMMLGGQINSRIQFSYGFHSLLSKLINKFSKSDYLESVFLATNLSTAIWLVLTLFASFFVCQNIFGKSKFNLLYIFLFNPIFIINAEEAWQMLILGTYLIILGYLEISKSKSIYYSFFYFFLISTGSTLIILSNSHHYWLYFPLVFAFLLPYFYSKYNLIFILKFTSALALGALISLPVIIDGIIAIKNSSSNIDMSPLSNLHRMEYAAAPLGFFVGLPLLSNIYDTYNISWPFNSLLPSGEGTFGPSILVLSLIGFFYLRNNILRLAILLMFLYWCGPLQLLFRFLIGGPFISETSVGGRFGGYIYIILLTLSIYAITNHLKEIKMFGKYINFYSSLVITVSLVQFYIIYKSNVDNNIWFIGIFSSLSCLLLITSYLTKENVSRLLLIFSLMIMPIFMAFSPYGHHSIYPYSLDNINLELEEILDLNLSHNDVGALAVIYKGEGYTKKPLPSNFWYFSKIRSINGFYTPVDKDYLYFYYYQYFSNWPSSIKSSHSIALPGSSDNELPTLSKLGKVIHRHHAMSIPVYKGTFSQASERFFDLTGVNLIAAEKKINFSDKSYKIIREFPEINLWSRTNAYSPIRITCDIYLENDKKNIYELVLFDAEFNNKDTVIVEKEIKFSECDKDSRVVGYDFGFKEGIQVLINNPSGILVTNIVYNENLVATSKQNKLRTFECNAAFTCIIPNRESSEIMLQYKGSNIFKKIKYLLN